jgi:GAF domain-containing protein
LYRDLMDAPDTASYQEMLEMLVVEMSAERGCLWLEPENRLLYSGDEKLHQAFPFSRQAVDSVLDRGRSFVSYDTENDDRLEPTGSIKVNKVRSCLCAACYDKDGELLALAYFDNGMNFGMFTEEDLKLLREVLSLVPGAVPVLA